jgi:hypothetical protein
MPFLHEEETQCSSQFRIIVDDQYRARSADSTEGRGAGRRVSWRRQGPCIKRSHCNFYGEYGTLAHAGMNAYAVTKQFPKSLDDGEAKSQTERSLACRIINLVVFFEYPQ